MIYIAHLSDDNTARLEHDSIGYRIIESTYGWIHPGEGRVFYLHSDPNQGGPIAVLEYDADDDGKPIGHGQLVTSNRSIVRIRKV